MFAKFNQSLFYDDCLPQDSYVPVSQAEQAAITVEELTAVQQGYFKANKSSGLSPLPLQLLKYMGLGGT